MTLEKMFDEYVKERGMGPRVLFRPEVGFATYHINAPECYIEDIFVLPAFRKSHEASRIADEIVEIAKKHGCSMLTGSVVPTAKGAEASRKVLVAYGFRLFGVNENFEKYIKEI